MPVEIVEKVGTPYLKVVIPKSTYRGQEADIHTAGVRNYLVTHADLSADLVYSMTKAIFDSTDELIAAHRAASGIKLEQALVGMPVPLHPGAERFCREKGLIK